MTRPTARAALLYAAPLGILLALIALTPDRDLRIIGTDLGVYADYGERLIGGSIPYRGFALEYPPLALVPMTLPLLAAGPGSPSFETYAWIFTFIEGALAMVVGWLVGKAADRPVGARATWVLLVLAAPASIAWRYDLWPAVLVLAALIAAERGRPGLAGIALGLGAMLKIFPIVALPVLILRSLAMRDRAGAVRVVLGTAAVIFPVMALTIASAGSDALHWLSYQLDRGLQLESVGAGLLLLLHALNGHPVAIDVAFGSLQVVAPGADVVVAATPLVELAVVAIVCVAGAVRFRDDVRRMGRVPGSSLIGATVAAIVALLVTSKVFSVQYVVWFLPLVPLLPTRQRWLSIGIAALSTVIYPLNYLSLWQLDPLMTVVLVGRNVLLVVLLAWLVRDLLRAMPRIPEAARDAPLRA